MKRDISPENQTNPKETAAAEKLPEKEIYIRALQERGQEKIAQLYLKTLEVCSAIQKAGGRALLVGGSVRDMLTGRLVKDFDLEVYGLAPEKVEQAISKLGKISDVGKAFGILKLSLGQGLDIDVSLPRTDSKISAGHRGFSVKTDPQMSIKEAGKRRDFTINSLAADPLTGEIFDPWGGIKDIRERRLRVTDPERFQDDPLRVLRGLQFIGRFGLEISADTVPILQKMSVLLRELPKERIHDEWKKLLLKSKKPSLGLAAGMSLGILREIHPDLPLLAETAQEPDWHPEGDAWIHTLMCVDEAAKIVQREQLDEDAAFTILLATLCHDLGKPTVTETKDGKIISHGHEKAGEEPTRRFIDQIGADNLTRDKVIQLVVNHLAPTSFYIEEVIKGKPISDGAIRRLAKRIHPATVRELALIAEADHLGRGFFENERETEQLLIPAVAFPAGAWLVERARKLAVEASKPADVILGRQLLALGYKPGKHIGEIIRLANELRDEKNFSAEQILSTIAKTSKPEEAIEILNKLL